MFFLIKLIQDNRSIIVIPSEHPSPSTFTLNNTHFKVKKTSVMMWNRELHEHSFKYNTEKAAVTNEEKL